MKSNRIKYLLLASLLAVLVLIGLGTAISNEAGVLAAPTAPLLWLDPVEAVAVTGSSTNVDVTLSDISNVYGIEFTMAFDPAILSVVGQSLTPGSCPMPNFIVTNTADNAAGTIEYAATQLAPTASAVRSSILPIWEMLLILIPRSAIATFMNSRVSS